MDIKESVKQRITGKCPELPFSFIYGGRKSGDFIRTWKQHTDTKRLDGERTLHVSTFRDTEGLLEVRCEAIEYSDFPVVEWMVRFKNTGNTDTSILEDIQPLDIELMPQTEKEIVLHHLRGSLCSRDDFSPVETRLEKLSCKKIGGVSGRSSDGDDNSPAREGGSFPFFNLEMDDRGVIFAIGWSGTWFSEFKLDKKNVLSVQSGMRHTRLKLHAGEGIRTPKILMFFWKGERINAHNEFRRLILAHYTPYKDGKPVELPSAACSWSIHNLGSGVTEENQIEFVQKYVENDIPIDCYWLDAGWYEGVGRWGENVGNWFPKKQAFPNGLKPVSDAAAKNGMGFVLWFEPERVKPGTQLYEEHPEFLLMPDDKIIREQKEMFSVFKPWTTKVDALLDLGNPEAREWITNHISSIIEECGVSIYRQDFNIDPAEYWRAADAPDRQGMTEIRFIEGLYEFWDELLRRHPGLVIDNCASGGRRIDLETISRSVVLWRTDCAGDPEAAQSHTLSLNQYYPCNGAGTVSTEPYIFRSFLSAGMSLGWNVYADDFDAGEARKRVEEFKVLRPLFYGNFYPLTVHSSTRISDVWCGYQLYREDLKRGAVIVFRRENSPYSAAKFKLHGFEPDGKYEFTDVDTDIKYVCVGKELMDEGIDIAISKAPFATIIFYSLLP